MRSMKTLVLSLSLVGALVACSDPEPLPPGGGGGNNTGGSGGSGGGDGGSGGTGGSGGGGTGGSGGSLPCGGCAADELCDEESGTCVALDVCDPACTGGFVCQSGVCVAEAGGIGDSCTTNAECTSGACAISLAGEGLCVAPCGAGCPVGSECVTSAGLCMRDSNAPCAGTASCFGDQACTLWEVAGGASFSACGFGVGSDVEGVPCTTGAECRTGLCSAPNASTGERICTVPCADDFGCTALAGTCSEQQVSTPALSRSAQVCDAPARLLGFAECCTDDAECDPVESSGCRTASDGTTRSCASAMACTTNDDCFFSIAGQTVDGECLDSRCVARACLSL